MMVSGQTIAAAVGAFCAALALMAAPFTWLLGRVTTLERAQSSSISREELERALDRMLRASDEKFARMRDMFQQHLEAEDRWQEGVTEDVKELRKLIFEGFKKLNGKTQGGTP